MLLLIREAAVETFKSLYRNRPGNNLKLTENLESDQQQNVLFIDVCDFYPADLSEAGINLRKTATKKDDKNTKKFKRKSWEKFADWGSEIK